MPSLYKKRGTWHIAYIVDGKRAVKNTKLKATESTKREAVKLKTEIENLLDSKRYVTGSNTLQAMCDKYRNEHLKLKSKSHQDMFHNCMTHFTKIVSLDTNVEEINSAQIAEFINHLTSRVSNATLHTYMSYLKMLFNFLVEEDYILKSPVKKNQLPAKLKKKIVYFDEDTLKSIFDLAKLRDIQYYNFLKLLRLTGQRPGDVLELKKSNFDMTNGTSGTSGTILVNVSKTKTQLYFPIYKELKSFITREMKFINDLGDDDLIFGQFNDEIVHKRFQRLKAALNLKGEKNTYTLKTFRKTFASVMATKGLNNTQIAILLAHESEGTTKKYYSAVSTDRLRTDIDEALKR